MAATKKDVDRWIQTAKEKGAKYIISVCDTFDYDDYPVYVMPDENLEERKRNFDGVNMQHINEVITVDNEASDPQYWCILCEIQTITV